MEQIMPAQNKGGETQRLVYTVPEAAELLGVNSASIYRAIARKKIRTLKIFRHKKIPKTEIDRLLAA
jgi:excisionase family DNA binding protein